MGMDVIGLKPDSTAGEYFRNSVWYWHPLWDYCLSVAPDLAGKVQNGHSNDGDGLDADDSKKLGEILTQEAATGRMATYAERRAKKLDAMPDRKCDICGGTGRRAEPPKTGPGKIQCNGCNGTGTVRPWPTHYPFEVENAVRFAEFLIHCGGFEIC